MFLICIWKIHFILLQYIINILFKLCKWNWGTLSLFLDPRNIEHLFWPVTFPTYKQKIEVSLTSNLVSLKTSIGDQFHLRLWLLDSCLVRNTVHLVVSLIQDILPKELFIVHILISFTKSIFLQKECKPMNDYHFILDFFT